MSGPDSLTPHGPNEGMLAEAIRQMDDKGYWWCKHCKTSSPAETCAGYCPKCRLRMHWISVIGRVPLQEPETRVEQLTRACEGLLEILEGESGAGANHWDQDPRYLAAKVAVQEIEK